MYYKILLDPKVKYSHIVGTGRIFNDFINTRFIQPSEMIQEEEFSLDHQPLSNEESLRLHVFEMRNILHIYTSKKEKKEEILNDLKDS